MTMIRSRYVRYSGLIPVAILLAGCQVGGSTVSQREGYFTWVDEQGRVRYSPIIEADDQASARDLEEQPQDAESEYTLENYPDADELAKDGYVRPGERQPYFTWRDAEGNVRVSYYRPDVRSDIEKGLVPPPIEITQASVYYPGPELVPTEPVEGYDPQVFELLGVENGTGNFFEQFAGSCCQGLETEGYTEWQQGREFGVDIASQSPTHQFVTGESPYHLIALSSVITRPDFVMRLRSFARDGVFVPSLAFLDRNFQPLRLVTDIVSRYEPENWHRRGFLEAWVPVFPGQGERWILVFTREEDLMTQDVIESSRGPRAIPHINQGELGLMMFEEE
ncbi:MalM family protein [Marinobacter salinexigens]|nr:MalM family protein [Marinobacter salinexigens]